MLSHAVNPALFYSCTSQQWPNTPDDTEDQLEHATLTWKFSTDRPAPAAKDSCWPDLTWKRG